MGLSAGENGQVELAYLWSPFWVSGKVDLSAGRGDLK